MGYRYMIVSTIIARTVCPGSGIAVGALDFMPAATFDEDEEVDKRREVEGVGWLL